MRTTEEDFALIRAMLELPYLIKVLDADIKRIDASSLRTRTALLRQLDRLREEARHEMREVRHHLRVRGIKIVKQTRLEDKLCADYVCRGHHDRMLLMWSRIKGDVEEMAEACLEIRPPGIAGRWKTDDIASSVSQGRPAERGPTDRSPVESAEGTKAAEAERFGR
ncbi:hypothetical protein [Saccharibacillus alkalitolerans]|uniref:Uncharacterized protein n=1 Tax=Saccharibacillus alkalitolerans TaxID=2705290 RepID=A0ABX0F0A1_9BACL|nr:hypothetical protein [Saccharibacillus alkalitolerans]NGZ74423.1 hypothetical protein [Saccharibacillus alkalitolerans]